jgi:hypothetical protein
VLYLFDPTIFDNLKVVIEGAVYDKDLEGEIIVVDRKDIIDLARMSRHYQLTFKLAVQSKTSCSWGLFSSVSQLSSELLAADVAKTGCTTDITFFVDHHVVDDDLESIKKFVSSVWGDRKMMIQIISPFPKTNKIQINIKLLFDRTIHEEDIDDLLNMFSYMEKTLHLLQANGY